MYNFKNDYAEGCHPHILKALTETNLIQQAGYGDDDYCSKARELIRKKIADSRAEIYFVSGGTQANIIVISAALRSHEAVIAAHTGHIFVHEAGAIEATGHKVISVPSKDGKLYPQDIDEVLAAHTNVPHMVKPRLVYISNSTEVGTIYHRAELEALSVKCREKDLFLFLDGARIGSAISAKDSDLNLADIARLTDAFYIGGTKNGALFGEAIVLINENLKTDFGFHLKQKGALLSKGRAMGIQFLELFKEDLYLHLARHANAMAAKITAAIHRQGYTFVSDSTTNQIFPILPDELIKKLSEKYLFYIWQKVDDNHSAIRLITSWATPESAVDLFIEELKNGA